MRHKEYKYTTKEIFNYFNIKYESDIFKSGQYLGGILIMKKNKHLINLLKIYEKCIDDNPLLITDIYNNKNQHPEFLDNRHDQSISSVLRKIHGSEVIVGDESYVVPFGEGESLKYPSWELE